MYVDPDAGTTLLGALDGLTAAVEKSGDDAAGRSNVVVVPAPPADGGVIAATAPDVPGIANMDGFDAGLLVAGMPAAPPGSVNPPAGKDASAGDGDPDVMLNVVGADGGVV